MFSLSTNNLVIAIGVVGNILSVVGIVICNKYITEVDGKDVTITASVRLSSINI